MLLVDMTLPRITRTSLQGNTARYEIEPLEPGYGMTIGHTLQRILQSSLSGAAITAIKLEGLQSECLDLPGVKEDIAEIVLNVKQIRLRSYSEHQISMHLNVSGVREVTAADIIVPDTIKLINPECHIALLEYDDARLIMELIVQVGRGYVPADAQTEQSVERIPVDAIYTPIRKATYTVEHTRVENRVNFEKITLEISTDGTTTPDEALRQSGELLMRQFLVLTTHHKHISERPKESKSSGIFIPQEIYDIPLEYLYLPLRTYNSLKRHGKVTKAGHLLTMNEEDLRKIRNIGDKSLEEIEKGLRMAGCFLARGSNASLTEAPDGADAPPPSAKSSPLRRKMSY